MNNETNIVQMKPKTSGKKRAKKAVAFLLVVAILITSAYAFLTAHQTKTNVFTVGNIRLELHEDGWEANSALVNKTTEGDTYSDGSTYYTSSKLENIIPGEPITKDPMVKNVGKNDARVYMSVSMPQINGADAFTMNNMGSNWNLFQTVEQNGYKVYYYHYATVLPANSGNDSNTSNLFQSVTLTDEAYSHMSTEADYSIIINAYGCQTVGEDDWQKAWNKIRTSDPSLDLPEIEIISLDYYTEDGELYFSEEKAAGDPISLKFEPALAKQNFSFNWVTDEGEVAYEGMIMPQRSMNLTANYNQITSEPVSGGYFYYWIIQENDTIGAFLTGLNPSTCPDGLETINIPAEITFTCGTGVNTLGDTVIDDTTYFTAGETVTVPVIKTQGFWSDDSPDFETKTSSITTVYLPDSLIYVGGTSTSANNQHVENIYLPYGVKDWDSQAFAGHKALQYLEIPSSVRSIGDDFLAESTIQHLVIPQNMPSNFADMTNRISGTTLTINGEQDLTFDFVHFTNIEINGHVWTVRVNETQTNLFNLYGTGHVDEIQVNDNSTIYTNKNGSSLIVNTLLIGGQNATVYLGTNVEEIWIAGQNNNIYYEGTEQQFRNACDEYNTNHGVNLEYWSYDSIIANNNIQFSVSF